MKDFFYNLLDWIYKKKCYFCGQSKECVKMCSKCYDTIDFLPVKVNRVLQSKNVYCAGVYNKNLQKLIRGLKYHNQKELAKYLAKFMYEYWQNIEDKNNFQVVPVPIYPKREKQRKYNHMNLVAEEFCRLSGCTLNTELIKRIKDTKPQYKLKKNEREVNLNNAFRVSKENFLPMKILLIDDICTTGSTFEAMIKEFEKNDIFDITCLAATTPFEE
ncbi:ComF family protein [bacterium]|nr:ComF family protein [bacterium]